MLASKTTVKDFSLGEFSEVSGQDKRCILHMSDGSNVHLSGAQLVQLVRRFNQSELTADLRGLVD